MTVTGRGIEMTERIRHAVGPIVDGQPSELVVEAMAAAMLATLLGAGVPPAGRVLVLRRYAERLLTIAAAIVSRDRTEEPIDTAPATGKEPL